MVIGEDGEMSKIPVKKGLRSFAKQLIFFLRAMGSHCHLLNCYLLGFSFERLLWQLHREYIGLKGIRIRIGNPCCHLGEKRRC